MAQFTVHTEDTAPDNSQELLAKSKKAFGMLPNLHAVMAESPELLDAYQRVHELFLNTSFNEDELTVVWQTINVENNCHYCVPAHTGIAKSMGVSDDVSNALRDETPLPSRRLEALRTFTLAVMRDKGFVDESAVTEFLEAGFTQQNILEVILGLSQKIMSNYTNHFADTPVDEPFKPMAWSKAK